MEKLNLQHFADEAENAQAPDQGKPAEETKDPSAAKYSDADLDKIISAKFAKWAADRDKAVEDARKEGEKLAKMNADQKKAYELEQAQKEAQSLKEQVAKLEQALIDSLQGYRITELKSSKDRAAWNRKEYDIAIVHPASMGHGLNLQDGGNIIVWYSMTFDLEIYQQANARLHRQGQTQKTLIHHLVTLDTYDEEAVRRLREKDGSQKRLIESLKVERRKFEE